MAPTPSNARCVTFRPLNRSASGGNIRYSFKTNHSTRESPSKSPWDARRDGLLSSWFNAWATKTLNLRIFKSLSTLKSGCRGPLSLSCYRKPMTKGYFIDASPQTLTSGVRLQMLHNRYEAAAMRAASLMRRRTTRSIYGTRLTQRSGRRWHWLKENCCSSVRRRAGTIS